MSTASVSEFGMDQAEMARRKRAYTTLSLSLFVSVVLGSIDYVVTAPRSALPIIALLALLLLLSRRAVHKSTERFASRRTVLTPTSVRNVAAGSASEMRFDDIRRLRVKTTVRGSIREIALKTSDGRRIYLNGLSDFERLRDELTDRLGQTAKVTHLREPMDFDHPWFYGFFGAFVGLGTTGLMRLIPLLTYRGARFGNLAISMLVLAVGVFWLRRKPGTATYGPKALKIDRVCGAVLICMGLLLGAHALLFL